MSYSDRRDILKALNDKDNRGDVFDGHDYEQGELEGQAASIEKLQLFCIKLAKALVTKGVFSKKEMIDLIYEYSKTAWDEHDPGPEELEKGDSNR